MAVFNFFLSLRRSLALIQVLKLLHATCEEHFGINANYLNNFIVPVVHATDFDVVPIGNVSVKCVYMNFDVNVYVANCSCLFMHFD